MLTLGLVSITYRKLTPAEIIPLVRDAGLTVSSYGSYYRLGAGQDFAPYLAAACALGAPVIRIWAGTKESAAVDGDTLSAWTDGAKAVSRMAAEKGVTVAFEYHHGTLTDTAASSGEDAGFTQ